MTQKTITQEQARKNTRFVNLSKHALERYNERFAIQINKTYNSAEVSKIIKSLLGLSSYKGLRKNMDKIDGHCFICDQVKSGIHQKMRIIISEDWKTILTITPPQGEDNLFVKTEVIVRNEFFIPFKLNIRKLYEKEIKKLEKKKTKLIQEMQLETLEQELKIAEINIKLYKTKSEKIKNDKNLEKDNLIFFLKKKQESIDELIKIIDKLKVDINNI